MRFGNERNLTIILFTLDESTTAGAGASRRHYPCLRSVSRRGGSMTAPKDDALPRASDRKPRAFTIPRGFNDDTRAFLSIPGGRLARRVDSAFLAKLVADHRLDEDDEPCKWRTTWPTG